MRLIRPLVLTLAMATLLGMAAPAFADFTAFIGTGTTPSNRRASGFGLGGGLLVVGWEFEYSNIREDETQAAPSLRTGMGNLLLQTPFAVLGIQPYFTTGGGVFREELGAVQETNFGWNTGGGTKVHVFGPLRARFDYRVFTLRGSPLFSTVHRFYAGANIKF
jgi:hypothetical protein